MFYKPVKNKKYKIIKNMCFLYCFKTFKDNSFSIQIRNQLFVNHFLKKDENNIRHSIK